MDLFECYKFAEAIYHDTIFTRSHPQGCSKLIDSLHSKFTLILKFGHKLKKVPIQTVQIAKPSHGGKDLLKSVILHVIEESIF